jgi:hypothetical protein
MPTMNYVAQTSAIEPDAQLVQRIAANGDASAMAELDARTAAQAPAPRWAQVRNDSRCSLRRGAWYNVLKFNRDSVVLDVHHEPRSVSSQLVHIAPEKPMRWSVVRRPDDSVTMPPSWGVRYAVCPHCQSRAELMSMSDQMWCESCRGVFPIDWAER